jgi:hypothetical protein
MLLVRLRYLLGLSKQGLLLLLNKLEFHLQGGNKLENEKVRFGGVFEFNAFDKNGNLKWKNKTRNLVVNEGLQHILDGLFNSDDSSGSTVDPWYVGIIDGNDSSGMVVAAGDTLASHAGWVEETSYTGDRKEYVGVRSSQTVTNTASTASFSMSGATNVCGAFLCGAATGTSAILLCAGTFTGGDKSLDNGDTLEVTYQFTAADDGA